MTHDATAVDVAAFMLKCLERDGVLYQEDIVYSIEEEFGDSFVYLNDYGNAALKQNILSAFKKLTTDKVVWCRVSKYWRFRMLTDVPNSRFADE
jgi:hypothetical protein